MICEKCLSRPGSLDSKRIGDDLRKYEWEPEKVKRVVYAVERFKKEQGI